VNELVPKTIKDLATKSETIDLKKAKEILQTIVSIHPESITPDMPLRELICYDAQQIREAASAVCSDVIKNGRGEKFMHIDKLGTRKRIGKKGFAELSFRFYYNYPEPKGICFISDANHLSPKPLLNNVDFPLVDPEDDVDRRFINFLDFKVAQFTQANKPLGLNDYQHLFQGVRLLFANMLAWNKPEVISLEQLDHLPPPKNKRSFLSSLHVPKFLIK
jgi:hypothetical protein